MLVKTNINKNMKTFGKILICIIVVVAAIGIAYLLYDGNAGSTNTSSGTNTNSSTTNKQDTANNTTNNTTNETSNNTDKNEEFIGKEENKEEERQENVKPEETNPGQETQELTGKDKAIDIVKKQYALDGQTVEFYEMEGNDYIIQMKDETAAITWYLVNGTTWEAEEY